AKNLKTKEGTALAEKILSAVKYNRTSSQMTNSYGLSIYFPYNNPSKVDTAVATYNQIGMDKEYAECIKQFAGYETTGQTASGGTTSPLSSLLGTFTSSGTQSEDIISSLLGSFLNSAGKDSEYLQVLDTNAASSYVAKNQFDASKLKWKMSDGKKVMTLDAEQWKLVSDLEKNVFLDDGEGYIDLGLDNEFDFDKDWNLVGEYDGTWLAVNNNVVAYYHTDTYWKSSKEYKITGRIPVLLNGDRAELIVVFDNNNPNGYIVGARFDYKNGETDTIAKELTELQQVDKIDFLCDYYGYDGSFRDSYLLGEQITVGGTLQVSNVYLPEGSKVSAVYRFTDIYGQHYWTPEM
ncbi:MAG: peptidase C11, partial [Clostridia bacterium]|nr:peptidase C11 [Clostridia bacterium]